MVMYNMHQERGCSLASTETGNFIEILEVVRVSVMAGPKVGGCHINFVAASAPTKLLNHICESVEAMHSVASSASLYSRLASHLGLRPNGNELARAEDLMKHLEYDKEDITKMLEALKLFMNVKEARSKEEKAKDKEAAELADADEKAEEYEQELWC